ncbi:putative quinol monooxygenase [Actinophytocola sp.]|uniref:putative quinol monooxygenase n=1 Tax=Actinophytocola sp. TaxID=1872138 RepID=UPI002D236A8C|nr:antibiotic biosynthesis monooxygenase [Actinophytocola sp.]HYQ67132.1 antibiotic biosynthesis monooxygenase [Actinophytocola sp.]
MIDLTDPSVGMVQLVTFIVEPAHQQEIAEIIVDQVERTVAHRPGFVSATYHLSLDGTEIMNYAQWASKDAFDAFAEDPASQDLRTAFADLDGVVSLTGSAWQVYRAVTPAAAR